MGARWPWAAVCTNLHIYSNFSGGADDCYECGAPPEEEWAGDGGEYGGQDCMAEAEAYLAKRKTGMTWRQIQAAEEIATMQRLAEKHGFIVSQITYPTSQHHLDGEQS